MNATSAATTNSYHHYPPQPPPRLSPPSIRYSVALKGNVDKLSVRRTKVRPSSMNRRLVARHMRVRDEAEGAREARKRPPRFLGLVGLHGDRGKVDGGGAGR